VDDRQRTLALAAAVGVALRDDDLAPLYAMPVALTEWSINDVDDPRGALRVSVWTEDHRGAGDVVARLAPAFAGDRERLLGDDVEGIGLALRTGSPTTLRWWTLANDGDALARRARAFWPERAAVLDQLWRAAGGDYTCCALGVELGDRPRATAYAQVRTPHALVRLLELAAIPVSRRANLFVKGVLGVEPGGRPWPKVWVGRALDTDAWKLYYFARGDDHRRSDAVLLDAIDAGPHMMDAWRTLAASDPAQPAWIQLLGLRAGGGASPRWTAYLAAR
jgi:hypothetical protein